MLRADFCCLGRWNSRDFLRGRTKRGGAIHTRHTHGSQGRYKRLSSVFGLRDGRRHVGNHMKGGLGIKLGGGLFGLRIPRQHVLSTMSREEYEIAIYGHPNITNPYRQHMDEHPNLRDVMRNASLSVNMVVLMPRVPRVAAMGTGRMPQSWEELLQYLSDVLRVECRALGNDGGDIKVHCATTSASVTCQHLTSESMYVAAVSLFEDFMRGAKIGPSSTASLHQQYQTRRIPFLGTPLLSSAAVTSQMERAVSLLPHMSPLVVKQSESSHILLQDGKCPVKGNDKRLSVPVAGVTATVVFQRGVQKLLQDLRQSSPDALKLCLRLEEALSASDAIEHAHETSSTQTNSPRKLLRDDMDLDETGVWKQPAATVDALMRWQYCNWDPRAHNTDDLPHHRRQQCVHIFVDASKVRGKMTSPVQELSDNRRHSVARSLMSLQFSEALQEMNFKRVSHRGLAETLAALRGWSVNHQWDALEHRREMLSEEAQTKQSVSVKMHSRSC